MILLMTKCINEWTWNNARVKAVFLFFKSSGAIQVPYLRDLFNKVLCLVIFLKVWNIGVLVPCRNPVT